MRKTVAGLAVSVDGVVESPSNWMLMNDEMGEVIGAGIAQSDAILLGRRTYLEFADLWPNQSHDVLMARVETIGRAERVFQIYATVL